MAKDYARWAAALSNEELAGYLDHIRDAGSDPSITAAAMTEAANRLRGGPGPGVYTLETWDKHGNTVSTHITYGGALAAAAEIARMSWRHIADDDDAPPADPDSLSDEEAVRIYFGRAEYWGEGYEISSGDVTR